MAKAGGQGDEVRVGWQMAGLGFEVAGEVVAGVLLGWLADRWITTPPNGMLIGGIVGIVVGLTTLIVRALKLNRQLEASARRRRAAADAGGAKVGGESWGGGSLVAGERSEPGERAGRPDSQTEGDPWEERWREKWNGDDDEPGTTERADESR